jgi:hypothetical protein
MEYHNQIQSLLDQGWTLWAAMKRVLLVVLEERDNLRIVAQDSEHIISNILTDSQLDTRTECGETIRKWSESLSEWKNRV